MAIRRNVDQMRFRTPLLGALSAALVLAALTGLIAINIFVGSKAAFGDAVAAAAER